MKLIFRVCRNVVLIVVLFFANFAPEKIRKHLVGLSRLNMEKKEFVKSDISKSIVWQKNNSST